MIRRRFGPGLWAFFAFSGSALAGPVSHWTLNGDLLDSGPGGNHGTFTAGESPVFVEGFDGVPGGAVSFDGVNDLITVAHTSGLPISAQPAFSVAMWVKGLPQIDKRMFSEGSSAANAQLFNIGTDNTAAPNTTGRADIFIRTDANSAIVNHRKSARIALDDQWHHLAWADDNGKAVFYIDGIRDAADFTYTRGVLTRNRTAIGGILRAAAGSWFKGTLDDVRIYDHALTEEEVLALVPEPAGCPTEGDTHLNALEVTGPPGDLPGQYSAAAAASDDSGDTPQYTFVFERETQTGGSRLQFGPQTAPTALANLTLGTWTIRVSADDDLACRDRAADTVLVRRVKVLSPPDLISQWRLNGDLLDSRPSANHGSFAGDVGAVFMEGFDAAASGAVSFDGVDDYVTVVQKSSLPIHAFTAYSVALWVKGPPGQVDRRVFSEGSTSSNSPLFNIGTQNAASAGKVDMFVRDDAGQALLAHRHSDRDAFDDRWHHLAWVDDGGRAVLYIDGLRDATDFNYTRGTLTLNTTSFGGILRAVSCCWWSGLVDDVRLYNYALTEAEVLALVPEPPGCPAEGDTDCTGLLVQAPAGNGPGIYRAVASAADGSGDAALQYTFLALGPAGERFQSGPKAQDFAEFNLTPGTWTLEATVDDDLACRDRSVASVCARPVEVLTEAARLVSRFALDGDLRDGEASANHGAALGEEAPAFAAGRDCTLEGALSLDGVDDLVRVSQSSGLPIFSRPRFSISLWVNGPAGQTDRRVFSESSTTNNSTLFNIGTDFEGLSGAVDIYIRGDDGVIPVSHLRSTGIAFDGSWHHLVYTDDQGQAALHIDGARDPVVLSYTRPVFTSNVTTLGGILRAAPSNWFAGAIDEVRIYNYLLTEEDIAGLYGQGAEPSCCPAEGDTHCEGLQVTGPEGNEPGLYQATATAADGSGDAILYAFTAQRGLEPPIVKGPQAGESASFDLGDGTWLVTVTVDDDPDCPDAAQSNTCSQEVFVCPGTGDTICTALSVEGPAGDGPGVYTLTASATDASGDLIRYTFSASNPLIDPPHLAGPQSSNVARFDLAPGTWTISVGVDDDLTCQDFLAGSICRQVIEVAEGGVGPFQRGDANADGSLDLSDGISILNYLFLGDDAPPCLAAANPNGEPEVSLTSGVYILNFLFLGGPEPMGPYPACGRSTLAVDRTLGCGRFPACQ